MNNRHNNGPGPIPNRWLRCPIRSDSFICNKFIAFKTPLDMKFDDQVPDQYSFYPYMLFNLMRDIYKKKLGLWIDLTNTSRFYNRSDIEAKDCQYVKLQCRGFGECPSHQQVQAFIELVDEFSTAHPLDVVAVHCTHGFNRTGFLISSYLVEKYDYDIAAAIQAFAAARSPGIYKQDYINELFKRYGDEDDEPLRAPPLPEWCYDEEETDDFAPNEHPIQMPTLPSSHPHNNNSRKRKHEQEHQNKKQQQQEAEEEDENEDDESQIQNEDEDDEFEEDNEGDDGASTSKGKSKFKKKRKNENIRLDATFMKGVGGVLLMTNKQKVNALQHMIQDMCEWKGTGFPGCQPVSMDRQNLVLLHRKPYMVSWKADGTRYMMLIKEKDEIYFFDRDNSCFKVNNMTFLSRDLKSHLKNTLLDGEMVIDKHNGLSIPRYLVYDIVTLEGENVGKRSFIERLHLIRHKITEPRHEAMRKGMIRKEGEPFSLRNKDFWPTQQASSLLSEKFARQLSHEPDGLIFQPKLEPYVCGRCDEVLKWKPHEQNSVDFQLKIVEEGGLGIVPKKRALLYVGSMSTPFAEMKYTKGLKDLNRKIIECKFENNVWTFMRERTDKSYPNAYSTAVAVCNSIREPVTKTMLLNYIESHRFKDDSELMPGPPPPRQQARLN